jgi:UDP-GlcNAc:undecaprenyl-phosphate GlcNAc-1-phosphate transferase
VTVLLISAAIALAISGVLAPVVLAVLRRARVLDHPTERSSHASPVPRGGGIAVAAGSLVALAAGPSLRGIDRLAIGLSATLFGLVGLFEDILGIRVLRRLAIQFAVAGLCATFLLGAVSGSQLWRAVFAAGVALWLVAFVNAYNFMDGINGISVAQAVGAGAVWLIAGTIADSTVLAGGGAIVAGAALGFAPFNVLQARMFLGDVGSYFIGAWLAVVTVLSLRAGVQYEAVLAPLALYAADTAVTLTRRVARGETWYLPHRGHAYQRLADGGWSHLQASALVASCIALCGVLGAVSLTGSTAARLVADTAIVAVVGGYLMSPAWSARVRRTVASDSHSVAKE